MRWFSGYQPATMSMPSLMKTWWRPPSTTICSIWMIRFDTTTLTSPEVGVRHLLSFLIHHLKHRRFLLLTSPHSHFFNLPYFSSHGLAKLSPTTESYTSYVIFHLSHISLFPTCLSLPLCLPLRFVLLALSFPRPLSLPCPYSLSLFISSVHKWLLLLLKCPTILSVCVFLSLLMLIVYFKIISIKIIVNNNDNDL